MEIILSTFYLIFWVLQGNGRFNFFISPDDSIFFQAWLNHLRQMEQ